MITEIKSGLPVLPNELYLKFTKEFGLNPRDAEALIEAAPVAEYFEKLAMATHPKTAANWILGAVKSWMNEQQSGIEEFPLSISTMQKLIRITSDGIVSHSAARQKIFPALLDNPVRDPQKLAAEMDLLIESGKDVIMKQVREALDKYPEKIIEYNRGKKGLLGLFVGEVMKISRGKADPGIVNKIIIEELQKRKS